MMKLLETAVRVLKEWVAANPGDPPPRVRVYLRSGDAIIYERGIQVQPDAEGEVLALSPGAGELPISVVRADDIDRVDVGEPPGHQFAFNC